MLKVVVFPHILQSKIMTLELQTNSFSRLFTHLIQPGFSGVQKDLKSISQVSNSNPPRLSDEPNS